MHFQPTQVQGQDNGLLILVEETFKDTMPITIWGINNNMGGGGISNNMGYQ